MPNYVKSFYGCKHISLKCPIEATVLGYYPNRSARAFTLSAGLAVVTAALGI
jgi:hypothetical protein